MMTFCFFSSSIGTGAKVGDSYTPLCCPQISAGTLNKEVSGSSGTKVKRLSCSS